MLKDVSVYVSHVGWVLLVLKWIVLFSIAWDVGLFAFHWVRRRSTQKPQTYQPRNRFAFLIPAHNEEQVLGFLLDSLNAQVYPKEYYHIYVAADRCHDNTASLARSKGATVIERWEGKSGKAWNIRYALEHIPLNLFDYVIIVDADNLVHPEFLSEINFYLQANPDAKAVQAYLDVKNPFDTWVTKAISIAYWISNFIWFRPREVLGLSVTLGGTGMVLSTKLLKERGWKAESLSEDLELHVDLVLAGDRVRYCERARVFDEKPLDLWTSYRQRVRWYQGHWYLLFKKAWPCLLLLFNPKKQRTAIALDTFLYLLAPARHTFLALLLIAFVIQTTYSNAPSHFISYAFGLILLFGIGAGSLASLIRFGRIKAKVVIAGLYTLPYGFVWFLVAFVSLTKAHRQDKWVKTTHTQAISLDEIDLHR
jgi:cellulose synthase/poly-beta-1,6-N-acetylglucosamine synthase-like glycosyltransferase